jgi:hypothetical protein
MTRRAFRALTRHFVGAIVEPPILSDVGIDAFRRTLISAASFFLCLGAFLPRIFLKKYRLLSQMPSPEPYLAAWPGDTLFALALPMYVVGFAAVIVSPMLFPDETDYRVLTPLPLKRGELFAAKLTALFIVSTAAILVVNAVISVTLPAVTGGRWAPHGTVARVAAHWLTACIASAWTVSAVMAMQGACILAVPQRWRNRVSSTVQASVFVVLLVSVPFFVRLTGRTVTAETVAAAPQVFLPPIWFLGVERWFLDGAAAAGYTRAAAAAGVASGVTLVGIALAFVSLFRSAESLAGTAGNHRPLALRRLVGRWLSTRTIVPPPQGAVIGFALRGLTRSRLHQFVFAVVFGTGLAMLAAQIAWIVEGRTLAAARPVDAMNAAIAAPLLLTLCLTLGLRAAFLLPLDRGAGWVFRMLDDPQTRGPALNGVASVFSVAAVVPASLVAMLLQPPLFGYLTVPAIVMTALAGLSLVELVLIGWRRIPYSCSYLPGKRHLTYTVASLLLAYGVFVATGSMILRASLQHPARMLLVGGLLLAAFAALRRARVRSLGSLPLEFEDEDPNAVIMMPLN